MTKPHTGCTGLRCIPSLGKLGFTYFYCCVSQVLIYEQRLEAVQQANPVVVSCLGLVGADSEALSVRKIHRIRVKKLALAKHCVSDARVTEGSNLQAPHRRDCCGSFRSSHTSSFLHFQRQSPDRLAARKREVVLHLVVGESGLAKNGEHSHVPVLLHRQHWLVVR